LLVLKTTGLNDSDERKSFIVPKTLNLPKFKCYPKNKDRVLYSVYRVNDLAVEIKLRKNPEKFNQLFVRRGQKQTGGEGGGKEGRKGGGRRRK
jgi:hypothetical protein